MCYKPSTERGGGKRYRESNEMIYVDGDNKNNSTLCRDCWLSRKWCILTYFLENGSDILFGFIFFVLLSAFVVPFFLFFERMSQRTSPDSFLFRWRREMRTISLVLVVIVLGFYRLLIGPVVRFLRSFGITYRFLLFLMLVVFVFHGFLFIYYRNIKEMND